MTYGPSDMQGDRPSSSQGESLIEYWRILRRRWATLVLVPVLGLVAAILITLPQTPVYQARAALEIQNVNGDFLNSKQLNPVSEDWSGVNALADVQTQMKILQSENLVERVVDQFKAAGAARPLLHESPAAALWRGAAERLKLPAPSASELDYRMQLRAKKSLNVRQMGQTRVLEILYDSPNPSFAADFVNHLTAAYIEANMDARWQMSKRTAEWLARQLEEMRDKLRHSEAALEAYARTSGLLFTASSSGLGDRTNVSEEKLRQLQSELSHAQADRAAAQSRFEVASTAAPNTLADVLNDPSLRGLQDKITELHREEAELIAVYTPKHERVHRVQAQLAPLEAAFQQERNSILGRIRSDYRTAERREALIESEYTGQSRVVSQQAEETIQYSILKREVDSNSQLYESMLAQVKEAGLASAIRASNVRIVDVAKVPQRPVSPDLALNAGLGLLSGVLLGGAIVILRERANRTLQEPGDVQLWTNAPELGVIPSLSIEGRAAYGGRRNVLILQPEGGHSVELASWQAKPSMIAEAFRAVVTSLMFGGESGDRPRVLVCTSAAPGEGKTTVVSNLAIALAGIRQRVLIIDADLRKPRMHDIFSLPNARGLSTLLAATSMPDDLLEGMVQQTSMPGLCVLPSGPRVDAAANLFFSPNLAELLERFRHQFDVVLVDTPPMLHMSDARVAGQLVDGVILVVRAGHTTRAAAMAAHRRLTEDRIRVHGTILNDWDPRKSPNGYYGYSNGSYGKYYSYSAHRG